MRRALTILATAAAAVTLTGCGGDDSGDDAAATTAASSSSAASTSSARPTRSPSTTPSATPTLSQEMTRQVFVNFLEGRGFIPTYMDGDVAVQLAEALCGRYDNGASYEDVVGVLLNGGIPAYEAGGFEGAAVTAFCPEHSDKRTG